MQVTALISNATPMPRRSIHMKTACAALSVKTKLPPQVGWKDTCPFSPPDPPAHTPFSLWTSLPHPATPNGNGSDPREAWTFNIDETSQQLTAQYTSRSIMSFPTKKEKKKNNYEEMVVTVWRCQSKERLGHATAASPSTLIPVADTMNTPQTEQRRERIQHHFAAGMTGLCQPS